MTSPVLLLLLILPTSFADMCSPTILGMLKDTPSYKEETMQRLVDQGEHTILTTRGGYPDAKDQQCITFKFYKNDAGQYREITYIPKDGSEPFTKMIPIDVDKNSFAMTELWPNGKRFELYVVHLEADVLGLYGCEVHGMVESEKEHQRRATYNTISKATRMKDGVTNNIDDAKVHLNAQMGLDLGETLDWCPARSRINPFK